MRAGILGARSKQGTEENWRVSHVEKPDVDVPALLAKLAIPISALTPHAALRAPS